MLRTPPDSAGQGSKPNELGQNVPTSVVSGINWQAGARSVVSVHSVGQRSRLSRASEVSKTQSQIRALELADRIEEEELEAALEQDRILAEQQLEALRIQKEHEMKREQKKAEFLRKRREREIQINELRSRSGDSICSSLDRVQAWVNQNNDLGSDAEPNIESERPFRRQSVREFAATPRNQPVTDFVAATNAMTEALSQAFKAMQGRNVKELPSFSGNVMDWPIFLNEFETSTKEQKLSNTDNLRRLNKALQGKARKAVESLLSSSENVDQIMRMLKSNFGRTEWIVSNRLEILRNLDHVKENNIESFRHFFNAVVGTAVALKNIKAEIYLMNPDLISHLAEKLPNFSKQMWIRHKATLLRENKPIDFEAFSRWLEDEMENQLASINPMSFGKRQMMSTKPRQPVLNVNSDDETEHDEQKKKPVLNVNFRGKDEHNKQWKRCPVCGSAEHKSLEKCGKFVKSSVEQRRLIARNCKVCYICLKGDHNRAKCKSNRFCTVCKKNHHELVHAEEVPRRTFREPETEPDSSEDLCNVNSRSSNTLLRVCKVRVCNERVVRHVFALFDEGSSISMMDASFAMKMGLSGPIQPVTYRWTNGISHKDDKSMLLNLHISGQANDAKWFELNNVRTINNINLPTVKLDVERIKSLYPLLDDDKLNTIRDAAPVLLIGSNNAGLIVPLKTVQYSIRGLQLTRCHLGWTIHGEIDPTVDQSAEPLHALLCSESEDVELTSLIKQMYKIEDFGITRQDPKISDEDARALDIMRRTLKRCGDRFEIGQIYKFNNFTFPDSKPQALRRLQIIEKKMDADPKFAEQYCQKIQDYLDKGYARKLDADELVETPNTWYLPHFSVVSANKFRFVMDAKAKSHGFSLNDLLLKGPDFVPPLIAVLMRGRRKKIAFTADIKEMFHQVLIRLLDQNSQRFLWRGMNRSDPPEVYVMEAMIFGAVSSPSIAQFIKNFNAHELEERFPGVERAIVKQHYVDDYFDCEDTEEGAIELIQKVIAAHECGGFKLVKFTSNSEAVVQSIDPSLRAELGESRIVRLLDLR